jgi:hypothetical protein
MLKGALYLQGTSKTGSLTGKSRQQSKFLPSLFLLMFLGLVSGCSQAQNEKAAMETLNQSFKHDPLVLRLYIGRVSSQCTPIVGLVRTPELTKVVEYKAAQKSGLINIVQDGPGFWKVNLISPSQKLAAVLAKAPHHVKGGCDDQSIALTVASKVVVDLKSLQPITSEKSDAVFTWKWALEPDGVKLVDNLSDQERLELAPQIERVNPLLHQTTFNLGDMTASTAPHQDKKTLKKSGNGWALDE